MRNVITTVAPARAVADAGGGGVGARGGDAAEHRTSVLEKGSFASARCTCGWRGPARRSRDRARRDATTHTAT
ncbi:hypothetical protein [Streptomyces sp. NBC_01190]|uniref:hypothetical protein n=1 Tax=Streptomyces sp. NBC_01190 TaxID=2903767 RepID=UPI0038657D0D|nr:hypothetical protein OG519_19080 [Streptomyces sp. NBC_01190]